MKPLNRLFLLGALALTFAAPPLSAASSTYTTSGRNSFSSGVSEAWTVYTFAATSISVNLSVTVEGYGSQGWAYSNTKLNGSTVLSGGTGGPGSAWYNTYNWSGSASGPAGIYNLQHVYGGTQDAVVGNISTTFSW